MPRKVRELKADLRRAGFLTRTGKGSHTRWFHPLLPDFRFTLSGQDGQDARRYQEEAVQQALADLAGALSRQGKGDDSE